jgi:hypothetical protein
MLHEHEESCILYCRNFEIELLLGQTKDKKIEVLIFLLQNGEYLKKMQVY